MNMSKSIFTSLALVALALVLAVPASVSAQTPLVCASTRTVAAGDWLSKIANEVYGNPQEYFPIFNATNSQAITDPSFHIIDTPDQLEIGWKLCIPAKPVAPAGLALTDLQNAAYKSDYGKDGVARLTDGKFTTPSAEGSELMNTVWLTNELAFGEINGTPSAAVILVESGGGSGVFMNLHVVQVKDGKLTDVASLQLGDRVNVTSLWIQDGKIMVGMTQQGPDDPMCCPTERVLNTYVLNGDKLELESSKSLGKVEQSAPPAAPTTGASAKTLAGTAWKWTTSKFSDDKVTTPPDPNQYLLQFNADGTLSIQADCNHIGGTYTVTGNQLTLNLGPSTLVACAPDSLGTEYTRQLGLVSSYLFDGENLVLEFKLDSGSMIFAPAPTTGLAGTAWQVTGYNNGKEAVVSVINGTSLTLNFGADGHVTGSSGCNSYSGTYASEGSTLKVGQLVSTLKACTSPDGIMDQEAQYLAALQKSATYQIDGSKLTIRDEGGAMQVTAQRAEPVTLTGHPWNVLNVNNGKEAVVSLVAGTTITLEFGTDGHVSGNSGCNTYTGSYTVDGSNLKVGPLASTRMACADPAGVMEQEQQFLQALEKAATFDIQDNVLTIRDSGDAMQVVAAMP